jgi:hypothetical protein
VRAVEQDGCGHFWAAILLSNENEGGFRPIARM